MKKYMTALLLIMGQTVWSAERSEHSHCARIGDFCHHQITGLACLQHNLNLAENDLEHFIDEHLGTDITNLILSGQDNMNDKTILTLANSPNAKAITNLNLKSTNVGYNGIVALWKSETFGSLVSDLPTYERYTGKPVSVIEIEIGHTKLIEQYKRSLFAYPLPLRAEFQITFGHMGIGKTWTLTGYKQIKLMNHRKELEANH